jgi:hypothetical protein
MLPCESAAITFSFHVTCCIAASTSRMLCASLSFAIPCSVSMSRIQSA